jgi:hypothetical protein
MCYVDRAETHRATINHEQASKQQHKQTKWDEQTQIVADTDIALLTHCRGVWYMARVCVGRELEAASCELHCATL